MAATSRLRTAVVTIAIPVVVLLIGSGAWLAARFTGAELDRVITEGLVDAARRGTVDLGAFLGNQRRNLRAIGLAPTVLAAARDAGREAARLGLDRVGTETLEDRFADRRMLIPDPALRRFLLALRDSADFADLVITDAHGFVAASATDPLRFVQADEPWWGEAMTNGVYLGAPQFDEVAHVAAMDIAIRLDDPATGAVLGVLRGPVRLDRARLRDDAAPDAIVEVVDTLGRIIVTRDSSRILRTSPVRDILPTDARVTVVRTPLEGGERWVVAIVPDVSGRWMSVVRARESVVFRGVRDARLAIALGAAAVLFVIVAALWWVASWMDRRVTVPLESAAVVAQRVGGGDLTTDVPVLAAGAGEVDELLDGLRTMVTELRTVVSGIRGASEELAAMAQQISASTEEMSASTQEMASTSQRLSDQATDQATQVRGATADAERILQITTQLAEGAKLSAERSAGLQQTAEGHRTRLTTGSDRLAKLAADIEQGAEEADTLAHLSTEIQQFVTQARTIATRTNMLALNAAIEAARAGAEGQGFAVVADEVRKLATQAAQAAQTTSETVSRVLQGVQATRERLRQLASESAAVRAIADGTARGLAEITDRATEGNSWADEIAGAATEAERLVAEITDRLRVVSESTESSVAAIEEIAAAAEEQSASTEEIASSASHLAEASERLNTGVSRFRLADRTGD